ncbi:MAG: SusC/RagA family TonB-linked outer membrane protein [Bacteroidales bacterium]|nr:SusC/RagA family TonB-linked outer membrane protein [Bacteroidales bacterium]
MNKNTFMYRTIKLHFNILVIALILFSSLCEVAGQEKKIITGYVYSTLDNTPLQGIKVSTKHRKVKSVTTNESGIFEIGIKDSTKTKDFMLVFSYPGYEVKEQYGTTEDTMEVYMTPTGEYTNDKSVYYLYDNQKYSNMTSAVEPVDIVYSTQIMSSSFEQLLQNSTARLTSASGSPGEGCTIKIRGYSTIFADEKPLIVIDGQVLGNYRFDETTITGYYQDPLINIDPRDIEAITILKDAPAAAIYGAKASNGVILIKTKDAKVGKTEFDITGHYGINFMNKRLPVIENSEYFKPYLLEQMYSSGYIYNNYFIEDPSFNQYYKYNKKTDWQDYIFEPGNTAGINIKVRGGDAIAKYFFSVGYLRDEGSVKNTNYNRFNARFNANVDITKWLSTQAKMGITYSKSTLMEQGLSYANPILNSLTKAPFLYPFIIDSNNVELPLTEDADLLGISNPYEVINSSQISLSSYNFMGTLNFRFEISKNLEANVRISSELNKVNEFGFFPNHGFYNNDYPIYNQVKKGISDFSRNSTEANVRYYRTFNEVHNLSGIVGIRTNYDEIIQDISSGVGTPSDEFKDLGLTLEDGRTKSGYQYLRREFTDFSGLSYNFKETYFIDLVLTADASSNIGAEAEPQYFGVPMAISPAIGLGWDISKLAGFNYNTIINYLKTRVSYGILANTVYNPYISRNYYAPSQYYTATGYAKVMTANESLLWEKTKKVNFGIDLSTIKQRLFISADVYYHNTDGLLNNTVTQVELGNESWTNNGDLNTIGSELSLKCLAYEGTVLQWRTELSVGQYVTKVANLENDLIYDFGYGQKIFRNGEIAGSYYGYEVVKVISSDAEANALNLRHSNGTLFKAGDIQFKDNFADGIIDDKDKVAIGNAAPDAYGSWVNILTYKQFTFLADISFIYGNELYNHTRRELESMDGFENQSKATLRRWQVDGQVTDIPTAAWGDPMGNSRFSDRWIEDGSFVRLKRITLSMNLNKWIKSANTSEIYLSGINLITLDKYLGYDPEFAYGSSILWEGIDYCKFPQNKSIMLGVKFGL